MDRDWKEDLGPDGPWGFEPIIDERIALTFGDAGENHVGMEMVGELGKVGSGFSVKKLKKLKTYFEEKGKEVEFIDFGTREDIYEKSKHSQKVSKKFVKDGKIMWNGGVLIVRNYLDKGKTNELYSSLKAYEWDSKYWDTRRKKVLNKHARANIVILDGVKQEPDYENCKGKILDTFEIKNKGGEEIFGDIKKRMVEEVNEGSNSLKADNLICEGNRYFNPKKCGIGFHGDKERRKVICLSLGVPTIMRWVWYKKSVPGEMFEVELRHGDMYIMSEKAVGYDWSMSSLYTLRHAAGCSKYITPKQPKSK